MIPGKALRATCQLVVLYYTKGTVGVFLRPAHCSAAGMLGFPIGNLLSRFNIDGHVTFITQNIVGGSHAYPCDVSGLMSCGL